MDATCTSSTDDVPDLTAMLNQLRHGGSCSKLCIIWMGEEDKHPTFR
jgi:hypothetical protein